MHTLANRINQWYLLLVISFFSVFIYAFIINEPNQTKNEYLSKVSLQESGDLQYPYLSKDIQARIDELQNPPDCSLSRRVIIYDDKHTYCGFGCFIHQVARLLQLASVTNRNQPQPCAHGKVYMITIIFYHQ